MRKTDAQWRYVEVNQNDNVLCFQFALQAHDMLHRFIHDHDSTEKIRLPPTRKKNWASLSFCRCALVFPQILRYASTISTWVIWEWALGLSHAWRGVWRSTACQNPVSLPGRELSSLRSLHYQFYNVLRLHFESGWWIDSFFWVILNCSAYSSWDHSRCSAPPSCHQAVHATGGQHQSCGVPTQELQCLVARETKIGEKLKNPHNF